MVSIPNLNTLESVQKLEKTLKFFGMELCLSDAITAGQMMLKNVFYFLILLISYVNHSSGDKFTLYQTNL